MPREKARQWSECLVMPGRRVARRSVPPPHHQPPTWTWPLCCCGIPRLAQAPSGPFTLPANTLTRPIPTPPPPAQKWSVARRNQRTRTASLSMAIRLPRNHQCGSVLRLIIGAVTVKPGGDHEPAAMPAGSALSTTREPSPALQSAPTMRLPYTRLFNLQRLDAISVRNIEV